MDLKPLLSKAVTQTNSSHKAISHTRLQFSQDASLTPQEYIYSITIMELEGKFRTEFLKFKYRIEFKSKQLEDYCLLCNRRLYLFTRKLLVHHG
jgi:hypothetical protein